MRVIAVALLSGALELATPLDATVDPAQCAPIVGRVEYRGLGYDHIVEVHNTCLKKVRCEVWTDVDPAPRHSLVVEPETTSAVVTRRGSPAQEFHAQGKCEF